MKLFKAKNQLNHNLNHCLKTVVKVDQLTSFDMIYVYHLLGEGTQLFLKKEGSKLNGDLIFKVMYNSFHLGFVTLSSFSKLLFQDEQELEATVSGLAKEKYLPLSSMEILVSKKALKMVS